MLLVAALAGPAAAGGGGADRGRLLRETWAELETLLAQASEARQPPLVPPVPVPVRWGARRVSSISLDAPLLALGAGDLDGDQQDELLVLTASELVVLGQDGRTLASRVRARLSAEPATVRPRDPVGTLVVGDADGDGRAEVAVRSSEQASGAVLAMRDGALVEVGQIAGFPLCTGTVGQLVTGRNYFEESALPEAPGTSPEAPGTPFPEAAGTSPEAPGTPLAPPLPARFLSARCHQGLVDPAGRALAVAATVAADHTLWLEARVTCPPGDAACPPSASARHGQAGTALALADMDRDGQPEVALAQAAAPGDPDAVTVLSWAGDTLHPVFERRFTGGVAGLAAGDFDGDGAPELVGAVRLLGSNRVDLWLFND